MILEETGFESSCGSRLPLLGTVLYCSGSGECSGSRLVTKLRQGPQIIQSLHFVIVMFIRSKVKIFNSSGIMGLNSAADADFVIHFAANRMTEDVFQN